MTTPAAYPVRRSEHPLLPDELRLGVVELAVTDLERSVTFYERAIGLREQARDGASVTLGAAADGRPVLRLREEPGARPPGRHAGLFHVAINYADRRELARVGQRLMSGSVRIQGASDHGTHEAWYLPDPDGNGLELAADRPRDRWIPYDLDGRGPQPLDVADLMSLVADEPLHEQAEGDVWVGHLHLHVGDLQQARTFYEGVVGFEEQFAFETALFVSAGGYHHHLGLNIWQGAGVPPAPDDVVGLRRWTIELPAAGDVQALRQRALDAGLDAHEDERDGGILVRDPWNHLLHVTTA